MKQFRDRFWQIIGVIGTLIIIGLFLDEPSFPTPDKLIVFLVFVFMIFRQTAAMLKRLLPFVVIILIYESFKSIVPSLNGHVNYTMSATVDKWLFGNLPTVYLQRWLWHGHVQWYDFLVYLPYLLFFVLPLGLGVLVWKTRVEYYWQVVAAYSIVFYSSFITFLLLPAAPPWLAAQHHVIAPITRISSFVWSSLGIRNFPSLYNHLAANPVAAFPSLHTASSTVFCLLIFKLYGRRWGLISLIYPLLLWFGIIYEGEHYVFDVMAGIVYGTASFWLAPKLMSWLASPAKRLAGLARQATPRWVKIVKS